MSTFQSTALSTRLLAVGGYFFGVAGFLFVLPVVHPWISEEEPTVEFCLSLTCH